MCGPALFAELSRHRLIDQYMLYVCPNVIGQGNHLFRDLGVPVKLAFDRTVPFSTGVNLHYYRPVDTL
jgi:riboflavin biosynthesis pyrimidine reductase